MSSERVRRPGSRSRRSGIVAIARVLGVSPSTVSNAYNRPDQLSPALREQILRTAEAIGLPRELGPEDVILLDGWHAGCYGIPDRATVEAIRLCARLEGMLTDPVYEGKSMAALIDLIRGGEIAPGSNVLYAHLGGQPALNAYAGAF